ncbi:MAG: hypothetical protein V4439_01580 [Patescibacteria group bacterium]
MLFQENLSKCVDQFDQLWCVAKIECTSLLGVIGRIKIYVYSNHKDSDNNENWSETVCFILIPENECVEFPKLNDVCPEIEWSDMFNDWYHKNRRNKSFQTWQGFYGALIELDEKILDRVFFKMDFHENFRPSFEKLSISRRKIFWVLSRIFQSSHEFDFKIPEGYSKSGFIDRFVREKKFGKITQHVSDLLTDSIFKKEEPFGLEPGKTYKVLIFEIPYIVFGRKNFPIPLAFCLEFIELVLRYQGEIQNQIKIPYLVSLEGLVLLQQEMPDKFPVGGWTFSFDVEKNLPKDLDGDTVVPGFYRSYEGEQNEFRFDTFKFKGKTSYGDHFICFYETRPILV